MKSIFTYILILSLSLRSLMFVGQIAYYELNIDYITEKFCENKEKPELKCNGKCHLAKELQLLSADTSTDNEGAQVSFVLETFSPLFFQSKKAENLFCETISFVKHKFLYKDKRALDVSSGLLKPPIS